MSNLKNLRITTKLSLLAVGVIFVFVAALSLLVDQSSIHLSSKKDSLIVQTEAFSLSGLSADTLKLHAQLQVETSDYFPYEPARWLALKNSASAHLANIQAQTMNTGLKKQLNKLASELNNLGLTYQKLLSKAELIGDGPDSGVLMELATIADKVEFLLLGLDSADAQTAVLNLRVTEQSLVESPNEETLLRIEDQISSLISLVSSLYLSPDDSSLIITSFEDYSEKLRQLVSTAQELTLVKSNLLAESEELIAGVDAAMTASYHFGQGLPDKSQALSVVLLVVLCSAFLGTLYMLVSLRKLLSATFESFMSTLQQLDDGEDDKRFMAVSADEFGDVAQSLNQRLDAYHERLGKYIVEADRQRRDQKSFQTAVEAVIAEKRLSIHLPTKFAELGGVATAVRALNFEVIKMFSLAKDTASDLSSTSADLKSQFDTLNDVAVDQSKQVIGLNKALHLAAQAMKALTDRSESIEKTVKGLDSVYADLKGLSFGAKSGISSVADSISSLESRAQSLVGLSENIRSFENIVSSLADRTHIVSLNVSMCSMDESPDVGVLREDVQQLAAHARSVSADVSKVASSVQSEVLDLAKELNQLFDQVASSLSASERVNTAVDNFDDVWSPLLEKVSSVSAGSANQTVLMGKLFHRSKLVRRCQEKSTTELDAQKMYLSHCAALVASLEERLSVFELPGSAELTRSVTETSGMAQMEVEHLVDEVSDKEESLV